MIDRKNEIVYATLELASENGLGAVSMQKIADRVGITKASLYNHFSSKDEIVDVMYLTIREASKQRAAVGPVDYDSMASEGSSQKQSCRTGPWSTTPSFRCST